MNYRWLYQYIDFIPKNDLDAVACVIRKYGRTINPRFGVVRQLCGVHLCFGDFGVGLIVDRKLVWHSCLKYIIATSHKTYRKAMPPGVKLKAPFIHGVSRTPFIEELEISAAISAILPQPIAEAVNEVLDSSIGERHSRAVAYNVYRYGSQKHFIEDMKWEILNTQLPLSDISFIMSILRALYAWYTRRGLPTGDLVPRARWLYGVIPSADINRWLDAVHSGREATPAPDARIE
jgi:hypothetical protein